MSGAPIRLPDCPPAIAAVLARLPAFPGSVLLTAALNAGLAAQIPADVAPLLQGRRFRIHVRDARVSFDFTWRERRFRPLPRQASCDLTLSASGPDFLRMATRQVDPDMLFFGRRLGMEGDTELGLVVKNTLDALELPVLDLGRLRRSGAAGAAGGARRSTPWQ